MTRRTNPEPPRCSWCHLRCRNWADLAAHEAEHRREERAAAARSWAMVAPAAVLAGVALVAVMAPRAKAETLHQLVVCKPGQECANRGEPLDHPTACDLYAASERLHGDVPAGTRIRCDRVTSPKEAKR